MTRLLYTFLIALIVSFFAYFWNKRELADAITDLFTRI